MLSTKIKKTILTITLMVLFYAAKSQVPRPNGLPTVNSTGWYSLQSVKDSFKMYVLVDTFPAKYPTTIWHSNGNFYKTPGGTGSHWSLWIPSIFGPYLPLSAGRNYPLTDTLFGTGAIFNKQVKSIVSGFGEAAIYGISNNNGTGVVGYSPGSAGVSGASVTQTGLNGTSVTGAGAYLTNNSPVNGNSTLYVNQAGQGSLANFIDSSGISLQIANGGVATYGRNNGSSFSIRSLVDKGYVDSSRNASAAGKLNIGDTAAMLNHYHQSFISGSFDTSSRILTLNPIVAGASTMITIPRGGSVNGINTLTPSRASGSNMQYLIADNGNTPGFSLNTTDSLTKVHYSDTAALVAPYLRKSDTLTMLVPYLRKSDTASMLTPYVRSQVLGNYVSRFGQSNMVGVYTISGDINDISLTIQDSVNTNNAANVTPGFISVSANSGGTAMDSTGLISTNGASSSLYNSKGIYISGQTPGFSSARPYYINYLHSTVGSFPSADTLFVKDPLSQNRTFAWTSDLTGGTVTNVSVVTANGVSGNVANPTTTPAITLTLGAITPSSVSSSGAITGTTLAGTIVAGSQPNITTVGTLGALTVTGNVTAGSFSGTGSHILNVDWLNLNNRPVYDVRNYSSINAAITAIGSTQGTLIIPTAQTQTGNLTIPKTLTVNILQGGSINNEGFTLAINGSFNAGRYAVFSGSGAISFGAGNLAFQFPEWDGAYNDGTHALETTVALNLQYQRDLPISLTFGTYLFDSIICNKGPITIVGAGFENDFGGYSTMQTTAKSAIAININTSFSPERSVLKNFRLVGTSSNAGGIALGSVANYTAYVLIDKVRIINFTGTNAYGLGLNQCQQITVNNCVFNNNYDNILRPNYGFCTTTLFSGQTSQIGSATHRGVNLLGQCADITFQNQVLEQNTQEAIYFSNASQSIIRILDCYFENNSTSGTGTVSINGGSAANQQSILWLVRNVFHTNVTGSVPQLKLDYVSKSVISENNGLGAGITTTVNVQAYFENNAEVGANDFEAIYKALLGGITANDINPAGKRFYIGAQYFDNTVNLNGTTSGTITLQPPAASGTYNFNLPSTAGTTGQVLTSQGGGGTAMLWTTPTTGTMTALTVTGANGISISGSPVITSGTIGLFLDAITPTSIIASGQITASGDMFAIAFNGALRGNANTATVWQTGRTLSIIGDLAYTSPSFDGSSNVTAAGTLAIVNGNIGSFTNASITVNGKGLVTAVSNGVTPVTSISSTVGISISTSGGVTTLTNTGLIGANQGLTNLSGIVQFGGTLIQNAIITEGAYNTTFTKSKSVDGTGGQSTNNTLLLTGLSAQDNSQVNYSASYGALGMQSSSALILNSSSIYSAVNGTTYFNQTGNITGSSQVSGVCGWNLFTNSGNLSNSASFHAKTPLKQAGNSSPTGVILNHSGVVIDNIRDSSDVAGIITNVRAIWQKGVHDTVTLNGIVMGNIGNFNTLAGTIGTASQPNITSLGTMTSLNVSGVSSFSAGVKVTGFIVGTGAGPEIIYTGGNGIFQSYDRGGSVYIPTVIDGLNVKIQTGGTIALTINSSQQILASSDIKLSNVGSGFYIKEGSNATMGTGTLVGGTATISTTKVTANSRIFVQDTGGGVLANIGALYVSARSAGTSFTVSSSNALDSSTLNWIIIEPN